jgi:16S rRNA processing protein RimM
MKKKLSTPSNTLEIARRLRVDLTEAEKLLWSRLRSKQIHNLKFRRQHPIPPYIADFFCDEKKLIIEIDGGQHSPESDKKRTNFLAQKGFRILRFWNHEVTENIEGVLEKISLEACGESGPSPCPLPEGEDSRKIRVAGVMTAHGVRGLVKLRCYLEDANDLESYNPLSDENGQVYEVKLRNPVGNDWVAEITGIANRNDAEKLRGLQLYIDRERLPDTDDNEFYYEDLIGCSAITADGQAAGSVIAVENFGAGDLLEIQPPQGQSYYLPIAEPFVQNIDMGARIITVEPAEEFMNE